MPGDNGCISLTHETSIYLSHFIKNKFVVKIVFALLGLISLGPGIIVAFLHLLPSVALDQCH